MTAGAMTIGEAAAAMRPPIPRRELARRLAGVQPVGTAWGRRGRRPRLYPLAEIMKAHAAWVSSRRVLANGDPMCQNPEAVEVCPEVPDGRA